MDQLCVLPENKRAESSAYKRSLQRTAVEKSVIYIRNNKGTKMYPCGIPHVTVRFRYIFNKLN